MESVKAFKFMNGWIVKRKHIDAVKDAISINRTVALEGLYVYGWAVKVEMAHCLTYEEAINSLRYVCGDRFIEESCGFVIMKADTKYLVLDISHLCETEEFGILPDYYRQLYDLLEGKF